MAGGRVPASSPLPWLTENLATEGVDVFPPALALSPKHHAWTLGASVKPREGQGGVGPYSCNRKIIMTFSGSRVAPLSR
jgi:hypothetical protein